MNIATLIKQEMKTRFFAGITIVSLLLTAFPAAFFVAEAATLAASPSDFTVQETSTEVSTVDASGHTNLLLSFTYDAEALDGGDTLEYGWMRTSDNTEHSLGTVNGVNEGGPADDETGIVTNVSLDSAAAVADLEIYFKNTGTATDDDVVISNITVTGDIVAVPTEIIITNITELQNAIENQADGQVWKIQAGDYGLNKSNIEVKGQTGWYFPITANNLTINGEGNPVIYGTEFSANGSHYTQNLVSVFGDNVTITGLTLMPKVEPNKTVEVLGENFTIEDVVFTPNTKVDESLYDGISSPQDQEDLKEWGGSLYFSHAGNHTVKNVTINNGGISFRYSPSGTNITFDNVQIVNETAIGWINAYRFSSGFNNGGNSITGQPEVTYDVSDTENNIVSVFENAQDGDTIEFSSDIVTTEELQVTTAVTVNGNGFTITPDFTTNGENNSVLEVFNADNVTINDLTIDSGVANTKNLHGINVYESDALNLNGVTLLNNGKSGLVVNSSDVTVTGITTGGNAWHGINVDYVTEAAKLTINGVSTHNDVAHIYVDDAAEDVTVVDTEDQYNITENVKILGDRLYTLKPGAVDPNNQNQLTITGIKFHNRNSDKNKDAGEETLAGWELRLYKEITESSWSLVATGTTNASGEKKFPQQKEAGTYYVCEVSQLGWTQVAPLGDAKTVNISPNATEEGSYCTRTFYNDESDHSTKPEIGNVYNDLNNQHQLNISGEVYLDVAVDDCDNRTECLFSQTNTQLEGWEMRLYKEVGGIWTEVATSTTNADGIYKFRTQYDAGVYHTCEVLKSDYLQGIGNWNGSGYLVNTANLSGATDEGPYCNTYTYTDASDKSSKSHFGNVQNDVEASLIITNPVSEGLEITTNTYDFTAEYIDDDVTKDNIQWAVRAGTCLPSTGTMAGNVDNFSDDSTFSGTSFNAVVDMTGWGNGNYCFVVNPREQNGEDDLRETRLFTLNAPAPSCEIEIVSGTSTIVAETNDFAVETYTHKNWTDNILGAAWIWVTEYVQEPEEEKTYTFKETFTVNNPTSALLDVAADNSYKVYINDVLALDRSGVTNNFADHSMKEDVDLLSFINPTGENTLRIEVTNTGIENSNQVSNPAGVLFRLDVVGESSCVSTTEPDDETIDPGPSTDPEPETFIISGTKFEVTDSGNTPYAGWTIYLGNGTATTSTTTDALGNYSFKVEAGEWEVYETVPGDWQQTDVITDGLIAEEGGLESCSFTFSDGSLDGSCDFYNKETPAVTTPQARTFSNSGGTRVTQRLSAPTPLVLGASTSQCPFLTDFMQMNGENDTFAVMKLQLFLNIFKNLFGGTDNPVTGVFDTTTEENVKTFQAFYHDDVLDPWYELGIVPHNEPTGFVYKTTLWKINSILCPEDTVEPNLEGETLQNNVVIH